MDKSLTTNLSNIYKETFKKYNVQVKDISKISWIEESKLDEELSWTKNLSKIN